MTYTALQHASSDDYEYFVTFGVYRFWRAYIDGYSALGVVYEVSLEVVMMTHA